MPGRIIANLPCRKCRYDLIGQAVPGRCPECGRPTQLSLIQLACDDPVGLDRLRSGALMAACGTAGGLLVGVAAAAWFLHTLRLQYFTKLPPAPWWHSWVDGAFLVLIVALACISMLGWVRIWRVRRSQIPPGTFRRVDWAATRVALSIIVLVGLSPGVAAASIGLDKLGVQLPGVEVPFYDIGFAVWAARNVIAATLVRGFLVRSGNRWAARLGRIGQWLGPVSVGSWMLLAIFPGALTEDGSLWCLAALVGSAVAVNLATGLALWRTTRHGSNILRGGAGAIVAFNDT